VKLDEYKRLTAKTKGKPRIRNARKVRIDRYTLDSGKEARRYQDLCLLEKAGEISNLEVHRLFPIEVNGKHICFYESDFVYVENGLTIVEDVKGYRTEIYKLKRKLVEAIYGIEILET